jgi:hypothetical protein
MIFQKFKSLCSQRRTRPKQAVRNLNKSIDVCLIKVWDANARVDSCNILTCPRIMNAQGAPGLKNAGEVRV